MPSNTSKYDKDYTITALSASINPSQYDNIYSSVAEVQYQAPFILGPLGPINLRKEKNPASTEGLRHPYVVTASITYPT